VDCTKSQSVCKEYEIQGYPTIKYFNFGKFISDYESERTEEAFTEFMINPEEQLKKVKTPPPPTDPIEFWKDSAPGYENVHMLKSSTFDSIVGSSHKALVMFYAPWCGHCKHAKPAFASVASQLASKYKDIILGAVDATIEKDLGTKYSITGFPAFKYFENGQFVSDYSGGRSEQDLLQFLTGSIGNVEL
jgi:protein disulfide-isomerase-like protein